MLNRERKNTINDDRIFILVNFSFKTLPRSPSSTGRTGEKQAFHFKWELRHLQGIEIDFLCQLQYLFTQPRHCSLAASNSLHHTSWIYNCEWNLWNNSHMSHTADFNQNSLASKLPPLPLDSPASMFFSATIWTRQSIDPVTGCLKWTRYITIPLANSVFQKDSNRFHFKANKIVPSEAIVVFWTACVFRLCSVKLRCDAASFLWKQLLAFHRNIYSSSKSSPPVVHFSSLFNAVFHAASITVIATHPCSWIFNRIV